MRRDREGHSTARQRGWVPHQRRVFQHDRASEPPLADAAAALAAVPGQELTYTCVPLGSGDPHGLDRDEDGYFDRDEIDAGSDPSDASSIPIPPTAIAATSLSLRDDDTAPINLDRRKLSFKSSKSGGVPSGVTVPPFASTGDPTTGGAVLRVYGSTGGKPGCCRCRRPTGRAAARLETELQVHRQAAHERADHLHRAEGR